MSWNETKQTVAQTLRDLVALSGDVKALTTATQAAVAEVNRRIDTAEARMERNDQALEARLTQQAAALESRLNDRVTLIQTLVEGRLMDFDARLRKLEGDLNEIRGFLGAVRGEAVSAVMTTIKRDALASLPSGENNSGVV